MTERNCGTCAHAALSDPLRPTWQLDPADTVRFCLWPRPEWMEMRCVRTTDGTACRVHVWSNETAAQEKASGR